MPTYTVGVYNFDPYFTFSQTVGGTYTYAEENFSSGTATITDNQVGGGGDTTLEGNANGETATADITINGVTYTGVAVEAEESWTLEDQTTGETFQMVTLRFNDGGGSQYFTVSERPLIPGRTYETVEFDLEPDADGGSPVFTYSEYIDDTPDGTVSGGDGDDVINDSYLGDPHAEQVDELGTTPPAPTDLEFNWTDEGGDETDLFGGVSQDTGGIVVDVTFTDDGNGNDWSVETQTQYVAPGETFSTSSSLQLTGNGPAGDSSTVRFDFSAVTGSDLQDEVQNVSFRINDIDSGTWQDLVTVRAYDADGNEITVNFTTGGDETVSGNTITGGDGDDPDDLDGSVLIEIPGPVAYFTIDYDQGLTGNQFIFVTDIQFEAVTSLTNQDIVDAGAGNDSIDSGLDTDTVYGGTGNDTINASEGDDTLFGGDDADIFQMEDGLGDDSMVGGEGGTDSDRIDASALTNGVTVTFTGDEAGTVDGDGTDATFSEIEEFILTGQADTVDGSASTTSMSIDAGAGADTIIGGSGNDTLVTGGGADDVNAGVGDDVISTGGGADEILLSDNFGDDTITGGETGTDQDEIDASGVTSGVTVTLSGDEAGTLANGGDTASFSEIEEFVLTDQNDVFDGTLSSASFTLDAGDGNDRVATGNGADIIDLGDGDDQASVGEGDSVTGGDGDDTFIITDTTGTGGITIVGGEGGETSGDTLNFNGLLDPGTIVYTNTEDAAGGLTGYAFLLDGTRVDFSEIENIICFARGTGILTNSGEKRIERLRAGDQVVTLDHGLQQIRWIGSRRVPATGDFAPIVVSKGVLGNQRDLVVSPQHRLLITGPHAELLFHEPEVLIPAKHLLNWDGVWRREGGTIEYFHMLFDRHEIVHADGALAESFHPGDHALDAVTEAARDEILTLFPELADVPGAYGPAARASLKAHEAELLQAEWV